MFLVSELRYRKRVRDERRKKLPVRDNAGSPEFVRNLSDPGDATSRNFRYQFTYGALLLLAAHRGLRAYECIWCEHHDDFLAQRLDGRFDAYQIKTKRPERGGWTTRDVELIKSIKRFA